MCTGMTALLRTCGATDMCMQYVCAARHPRTPRGLSAGGMLRGLVVGPRPVPDGVWPGVAGCGWVWLVGAGWGWLGL
eukprot:365896-Chlamydomonas_euryale.AAC.1